MAIAMAIAIAMAMALAMAGAAAIAAAAVIRPEHVGRDRHPRKSIFLLKNVVFNLFWSIWDLPDLKNGSGSKFYARQW